MSDELPGWQVIRVRVGVRNLNRLDKIAEMETAKLPGPSDEDPLPKGVTVSGLVRAAIHNYVKLYEAVEKIDLDAILLRDMLNAEKESEPEIEN